MISAVEFERTGRKVSLNQPLGSGGQGVVFHDPGDPGQVIKTYEVVPTAEQAEKLRLLIEHGIRERPGLDGFRRFAWPEERVLEPGTDKVVGFAMPKIAGKPLFNYYDP